MEYVPVWLNDQLMNLRQHPTRDGYLHSRDGVAITRRQKRLSLRTKDVRSRVRFLNCGA